MYKHAQTGKQLSVHGMVQNDFGCTRCMNFFMDNTGEYLSVNSPESHTSACCTLNKREKSIKRMKKQLVQLLSCVSVHFCLLFVLSLYSQYDEPNYVVRVN